MMKNNAAFHPTIQALLNQGMGSALHWFPEDVSPVRLAPVLVGMANSKGGTVLIGVAPRSGQIQGVRHPEEILDRVFQAALLIDPSLVLPIPVVLPAGPHQVVQITIPHGLPYAYNFEGRYFTRQGAHTVLLPARELRGLLVARGVIQFEAQTPADAAWEDLDPEKVEAYVNRLRLPEDDTAENVLLKRGCLKRMGGGVAPTYAALLLFGHQPQQWVPSATILAARFSGLTFSDRFVKLEIAGTLPEQLQHAEAFILENMRSVVRLVGLRHEETLEYPLEAVRELLVNAVAHRDYNFQGDSIHVNVFADRIEVHSPGALPGPVNLENLLEARFSRNPVIVQVLSDLGYIERLGYGLDRVVAAMRKNDLPAPRFEEAAGTFRVTLFGEPGPAQGFSLPDLSAFQAIDLNPRQQAALSYLAKHRRITNREYQDLCPDVHPETLRRDLANLVESNVVIKVGDKKATYYILK